MQKKVLLVANWDWVLYNFRLALAKTLMRHGYEVVYVCPRGQYIGQIEAEGIRWVDWPLSRRSLNPLGEIRSIRTLAQIYRDEDPSLIHHDTIKPNFYGSIAVSMNREGRAEKSRLQVINTFMGLGYLFSKHRKATLLRRLLLPLIRYALRKSQAFTVFSNQRDLNTFVDLKLLPADKMRVMVSECVDVNRFQPNGQQQDDEQRPYRVLMAARLLWDKGVKEFVEASRLLRGSNQPIEFWLAGMPDKANPAWVPEQKLQSWEDEKLIRWLGHCDDMPDLLKNVDIATLPTHYNEGLPRFLVESAASGLPLIATDIPACRAIVRDGVNGIIIPSHDGQALANAIIRLLEDDTLRTQMSQASRNIAIEEYNEKRVLDGWLELYQRLAPVSS